jgi:AGCS family alanine or glycine:cation symporter
MSFLAAVESALGAVADWIWDLPLLLLITGGGLYFLLRSRLVPIRHLPHALQIIRGKYDRASDHGQVSHYKALSVALASTIGMGNISGVAIAVGMGGPGVIFWMWVTAIVGMATKYFTCSLAILYRGRNSAGQLEGGPMYFIVEGLGPQWRPLAVFFCWAAMVGCLPVFTVNQLTAATHDLVLEPLGFASGWTAKLGLGAALCLVTAAVIFGGLQRIAGVVAGLVPVMVIAYLVFVSGIMLLQFEQVPLVFSMIVTDAFAAEYYSGEALFGGTLGGLIVLGARRGTFSNEAGIGTAPMAHGAAKTDQPVHEGMVAMLGPAVDTLVVCSLTGFAVLVSGEWTNTGLTGIAMVLAAFENAYPHFGAAFLYLCIACFALSSLFGYSYYGTKSAVFLFGAERGPRYRYAYLASILLASVASTALIVYVVDIAFALMAIPTMTATLLLSPRVVRLTRAYFSSLPGTAR